MKLKEFFTDSSKWTQHANWKNENNIIVYHPSEMKKCCLLGGISYLYHLPEEQSSIRDKIRYYIKQDSICDWNDSHTFEDVKKLVEELEI